MKFSIGYSADPTLTSTSTSTSTYFQNTDTNTDISTHLQRNFEFSKNIDLTDTDNISTYTPDSESGPSSNSIISHGSSSCVS